MPVFAIPNPFSGWPAEGSRFDTDLFKVEAKNGIVFAGRDRLDSMSGSVLIADLRGHRPDKVKVKLHAAGSKSIVRGAPDPLRFDGRELSFSNYVASVAELLLYLRVSTTLTSIGFVPESIGLMEGLASIGTFNGVGVADSLEKLFDELRFEPPPATLEDAKTAGIGAGGVQRGASPSKLGPNPFANPDIIDVTHEIRRNLRDLARQLKNENTEELVFERQDLVSLMRQMLIILGEDGDIPPRALRAIPEEGHKLSLSLSKVEQTSSRLTKLFENGTSIYDHILSLRDHFF